MDEKTKNDDISRRQFIVSGVAEGVKAALHLRTSPFEGAQPESKSNRKSGDRRLRLRTGTPINTYGQPLGGPFTDAHSRVLNTVRRAQVTSTLQLALGHRGGPSVLTLLEFQKDHWGPWEHDHRSSFSRCIAFGQSVLLRSSETAEESTLGGLTSVRFTPWGTLLATEAFGYLVELDLHTMLFRKHLAVGALNAVWMKWIPKEQSRFSFYFVGRDLLSNGYWLFRFDPSQPVDLKRENENAQLFESGKLFFGDYTKRMWRELPQSDEACRYPYEVIREISRSEGILATFPSGSVIKESDKTYFDGVWLERDALESRIFI